MYLINNDMLINKVWIIHNELISFTVHENFISIEL